MRSSAGAVLAVIGMVMAGCGLDNSAGAAPASSGASATPTALPTVSSSPAPRPTPSPPRPTPSPTGSHSAQDPRWLQPTTTIIPAHGCTILTSGMNGIKVKMVQRRLGFPADAWETMGEATIAAVRRFQRQAGLTVDGVVGRRTWRAMGFREDFCFDRYQAQPVLPSSATARERREQMIAFGSGLLGEEYVWGGAGPRGYGVDCSGLVLQALYSAGLDPQPITVDKHVLPDYRTSGELYAHPRLAHFPMSDVRRGDLVFWRSNETGKVNHVAIYLGGGTVLEAIEPVVHYATVGDRSTQTMMPEVVRPFGVA